MKLVGNILEIKGRGVLLLGLWGKSSTSMYLPVKYDDVFLVADDYCNILFHNTRKYEKEVQREVTEIGGHKIPEEFITYNIRMVRDVIGTNDSREPTGKMRNPLGQLDENILTRLRVGSRTRMDKLRRRTLHVDTMAQRMAHKACVRIDYVMFFGSSHLRETYFIEMIENMGLDLKNPSDKEMVNRLAKIFFSHREATGELVCKKNNYHIETDPNLKKILIKFIRRWDSRGDDWTELFLDDKKNGYDAANILLTVFYAYDDVVDKIENVYSIVVPDERLEDMGESGVKFEDTLDKLGLSEE